MGAVGLTGALIAQPLSLGPIVGAFAVTVLLALFALAALAMAVDFAEQTTAPRLLAALRVQRTPMIAALGAWLLFSPAFIDPGAHDIRLITDDSASAAEAGIGIEAVWDRYSASALSGVTSPPSGERLAMPLVLISSSGGGTRAATWTAYVLDCLFSAEPVAGDARVCPDPGAAWRGRARDSVAAVIGVSGGGLGLATFLLHGLEGPTVWTTIHKVSVNGLDLRPTAAGDVPGSLLNQWAMDEADGFNGPALFHFVEQQMDSFFAIIIHVTICARHILAVPHHVPVTRIQSLNNDLRIPDF